jgi:transposase
VVPSGPHSATLAEFFAELGPRKASIRAVSIDMSGEYQRAIRDAIPDAQICFDPFHVCRLASRATDQVRRDKWNAHERSHTATGRWVKGTRRSVLKAPERQTVNQLAALYEVQHANRALYRALLLREELRLLYHLDDPRLAPAHLDARLAWASRARLRPFVRLARTLQPTATASSPRSASGSPTAASRASTARSA